MNTYQQTILDHYHHPRHEGTLTDATHSFKLENQVCGDAVEVFLKVTDNTITDASFTAEGCAISVASASLLLSELIGKSVDTVHTLQLVDIKNLLEIELSSTREQCALLPLQALQQALAPTSQLS